MLHGILKMIISEKYVNFTSVFWKTLFGGRGTKLNFSTAYHPQKDGQSERKNQFLEDMLHMYVMERTTRREYFLHLEKFSYNNSYQA